MPTLGLLKVVRLRAGEGAAARALAAVEAFVAAAGVPASTADRLAIVVEEWLLNLIEHGRPPPGSLIVLRLERVIRGVRIGFSDAGAAFDPRLAPDSGPNEQRGGGAGIALIRAWTRIEDYRRKAGRNRLALSLADED